MPDISSRFNLEIEAKNYDRSSSTFKNIAMTLGLIGIVIAFIMFIAGVFTINRGGFATIVGAVVLGIQSFVLMIIGDMMYGLSRVSLATLDLINRLTESHHQEIDDGSTNPNPPH